MKVESIFRNIGEHGRHCKALEVIAGDAIVYRGFHGVDKLFCPVSLRSIVCDRMKSRRRELLASLRGETCGDKGTLNQTYTRRSVRDIIMQRDVYRGHPNVEWRG